MILSAFFKFHSTQRHTASRNLIKCLRIYSDRMRKKINKINEVSKLGTEIIEKKKKKYLRTSQKLKYDYLLH